METLVYDFGKIEKEGLNDLNKICSQLQIHNNPSFQVIQQLIDIKQQRKENTVRFVCISDTHCDNECFKNVPDGDVLIHSGDFTHVGAKKEIE